MNQRILFLITFSISCAILTAHEKQFTQSVYSFWGIKRTIINYYVHNTRVGFIHCTKIPLVGHLLYNLYVYPAYRNKGYGKDLIFYVSNFLKNSGAHTLYIQPGPFELNEQIHIEPDSARLKALVALYTKCGFQKASPLVVFGARIVYGLISLHEDARYLMVNYL